MGHPDALTLSHFDDTKRRTQFATRPLLVFWETTTACELACRHCRANAQLVPGPDELSTSDGRRLIDSLAAIGRPRPILILTGGDCLMRDDIVELARYAQAVQVPVAIAPSVTNRLTGATLDALRGCGVSSASLSLDGATAPTHDGVRGIPGHFDRTLEAIDRLIEHGFTVQVNTTVMIPTVEELADVAVLVHRHGVSAWEVFFLIETGRGTHELATTASQNEEICRFLVDASRRGFTVRTVEAPFFRRLTRDAANGRELEPIVGGLHERLRARLDDQLGEAHHAVRAPSAATRDGKGIIFVAANGDVFASGFLPLRLGNVRERDLIEIYRDDAMLRRIRSADFVGPCGTCAHADLCGGSRSRAFAITGDPLASDPGCLVVDRRASDPPFVR